MTATGYLVMALLVSGTITVLAVIARRYFFADMAPYTQRYGPLPPWLARTLDGACFAVGPGLVWLAITVLSTRPTGLGMLVLFAVNVGAGALTYLSSRHFDRRVAAYFLALESEQHRGLVAEEVRHGAE